MSRFYYLAGGAIIAAVALWYFQSGSVIGGTIGVGILASQLARKRDRAEADIESTENRIKAEELGAQERINQQIHEQQERDREWIDS